MKISIITATYNSEDTVKDTIKSILSQTYTNFEIILQDGNSSDSTIELVKSFNDNRIKIEIDNDLGIYDAMNKGISRCSGEIIGILNSDDFYSNSEVLANVISIFNKEKTDTIYANLQYVDSINTDKIRRTWISNSYSLNNWILGWMPPHPTFFVKRGVYEKYGTFNLILKSAADYEIMLRFLFFNKLSTAYLNMITVKMRDGGQSNASIKNRIKANREDKMAWSINGAKAPFGLRLLKPLRKISQYLKK